MRSTASFVRIDSESVVLEELGDRESGGLEVGEFRLRRLLHVLVENPG
jgi:hypothetical protein